MGIEDRKEQEIAREKTLAEIRRCGAGIGSTGRDILQLLRSLNLVAVNASIEASRAGAMGAGFAVVAEEVKRLADESRDSVNRILEFMEALEKVTGERSQLRL
ncbi:MAG: methyl-accepting chemotaxis protein [Puniceicoccaceae bacterium]|nr:MAG: methyl-accepting chemotaxis protein [Puniceicoccaceae bacterium]